MKKPYGIIYKCTNKINGKVYIGQTIKTLEHRRKKHLSNARVMRYSLYFYKALNKYGFNNFHWEEVSRSLSRVDLNKKEINYIKKYNSTNLSFGYNISSGGSNGNNFFGKSNEEKREISKKISISRKNYYKKNKHWNLGNHWSLETKEKIREGNKKRTPDSLETRIKKSIGHKGIFLTKETRDKISLANKGKIRTGEMRERISQSKKNNKHCLGRKLSDETRKKIRMSNLGKHCGEKNPMFGSRFRWMTKDGVSRRVDLQSVNNFINKDWMYGRK